MTEKQMLQSCSWAWANPRRILPYGETSPSVRYGDYIENQVDVGTWVGYQGDQKKPPRSANAAEILVAFVQAGMRGQK